MGILSRTIFIEDNSATKKKRFHDFCLTNTTLGACVEPFQLCETPPAGPTAYATRNDPSDEMQRIDKIEFVGVKEVRSLFRGLHWGTQLPRLGYN